jgi:probable phosphomutase (TIGR03848 family)
MPTVLLIRHGENDYARRGVLAGRLPGVHLNKNGQLQAEQLAEALCQLPIRAIYSSPLERATETAKPLAARVRLQIRKAPGLIESDVGEWEGRSVRRLARSAYWRIVQQAPSRASHPGGESFLETQARVVRALDAIYKSHGPRDLIACVLHSDPIKLAVAHYLGLPLDHFQRLACDPASVTMLAIGPGSARLIWLNRQPPFAIANKSAGS